MRLPSLSTGLLVFLLASILFIDGGEARLGPGGTQGVDGTDVQRRRMLEEEQQQVSFSSDNGNVNDSPAEPQTKPLEESPKIVEQKKEQGEVKKEEPKKVEETKVAEQTEVKTEEPEEEEETKVVEQADAKRNETKKEETKVTDKEKRDDQETKVEEIQEEESKVEEQDETKIEGETKKEVENEAEEKSTVQIQGVKENRIESTEEGSKREEQLLAEALFLEEQEERRGQVEVVDISKPDAERQQQEIVAADNEPITVSSWESKGTDDETIEKEEQQPQAEVKKEETQGNKTKDESKPEEKKDAQLKEDTKTEGLKESVHQQSPEEKKEAEKSVKKDVSEEKPAEKKVEQLKPSSPAEKKVDLEAGQKKSEPIVKVKTATVKETIVTSDSKKEELNVDQKQQVEDETEVKETKQEDKQDESISTDPTDSSESDDDYPDFIDEFLRFPERLQESAEHLKTNVPGWEKLSTNSKDLFNQANEHIKESFTPLIGRDYAPVVAYLVSYGLLLLPLGIAMFLFERIRAILSLQKVLLFINIYVAAYFAALVAAAFILGTEPMDFFRKFSPSSYIFLQLLQAFGYIMFIILQTFDLITTCSSGRIAAKLSAALQWLVVVAVGFHYYVTVFHRAMAKSKPLTSWKVFGLYSISFTILCLFARIERGKKQYIQEGGQGSTKQN